MLRRYCHLLRTVGVGVLSFGGGIIVSFFLPSYVLVWIEALLLIGAGLMYLMGK